MHQGSRAPQPQIDVFGLCLVPAWPLPLFAASTFLHLKIHQRYRRQQREVFLGVAERCLPYILLILYARTLHLVVTSQTHQVKGLERQNHIILVEFVALVSELACTRPSAPYAALIMALAWISLMNISRDAQQNTKLQLRVAQLLSVSSCTGVPANVKNAGILVSGLSLLTMTTRDTMWRGGHIRTVPRVVVALAGVMASSLLLGTGLQRLPYSRRAKLKWKFHIVCRALAMLEVGAAGMYVTAYLWSCLGWRSLMRADAISRPPALNILSLGGGGGLFSLMWALRLHWKVTRDPWHAEREHSLKSWTRSWIGLTTETVAWTTTLFGLVYLLLYLVYGSVPQACSQFDAAALR